MAAEVRGDSSSKEGGDGRGAAQKDALMFPSGDLAGLYLVSGESMEQINA